MRITGGELKGWHIHEKFSNHVRPTTDMMREAICNKLVHGIGIENNKVLDLFSGSGIMSIEFLSRGASEVIAIDKDARNIANQKNMKKEKSLGNWQILNMDAFNFLRQTKEKFDIIFADPPYDLPGIQNLAELAVKCLAIDGLFILEHRPGILFTNTALETKKYGSTSITIFESK
jgi:16S rRNA (guanine966-N2)-methyltransferase